MWLVQVSVLEKSPHNLRQVPGASIERVHPLAFLHHLDGSTTETAQTETETPKALLIRCNIVTSTFRVDEPSPQTNQAMGLDANPTDSTWVFHGPKQMPLAMHCLRWPGALANTWWQIGSSQDLDLQRVRGWRAPGGSS